VQLELGHIDAVVLEGEIEHGGLQLQRPCVVDEQVLGGNVGGHSTLVSKKISQRSASGSWTS
jgi:hypothetical protein